MTLRVAASPHHETPCKAANPHSSWPTGCGPVIRRSTGVTAVPSACPNSRHSMALREMTACRPWLQAEPRTVGPDVIVAPAATAGKSLLGTALRVTKEGGALIPLSGEESETYVVATLHPSAVLRSDDRESAYAGLVCDLRVTAEALHRPPRCPRGTIHVSVEH
ncbi:uracil-DNA glycosylase family protein [Streptomyces maoxianensis]|uniref:Uracil-DNA glycosylase family protein n=1 Tax=Streptomyces maoxianensis TaxID=1459942 RepID=A0ABV9GBQ3_9ACTN